MYIFWDRMEDVARRPSEEAVLEAVRTVLEEEGARPAINITKPDCMVRNYPAVDQVFQLEGETIAIEHTRLLAYDDEIGKRKLWDAVLEPSLTELDKSLSSQLPVGFNYELWIDVASKIRKKDWPAILQKLDDWILHVVCDLASVEGLRARVGRLRSGKSNVWLRLGMYPEKACPSQFVPRFQVRRVSRFSEGAMRTKLVGKAFREKAGKLHAQKKAGARTVLVLEWRSGLATPAMPSATAQRFLREQYPEIDEVITIYTMEEPWAIIRCRRDMERNIMEERSYVLSGSPPVMGNDPRELLTSRCRQTSVSLRYTTAAERQNRSLDMEPGCGF